MLSSAGSYNALLIAQLFISDWVDLLTDVLAAVPEARGRLLLDMINEPDGYGFTWYGRPAEITLCQALWVIYSSCMCSVVIKPCTQYCRKRTARKCAVPTVLSTCAAYRPEIRMSLRLAVPP